MKKMYSNLYIENRNLVGELLKRNNNHEALVSSLKQINNMINKASNLRCTSYDFHKAIRWDI
jgi:Ciliary BBSome complex subunit 2, C-terminal